jgi:hypothetical protein
VRSRQLKLVGAETEPVLERFVRSREEWLTILGILYPPRDSGGSKSFLKSKSQKDEEGGLVEFGFVFSRRATWVREKYPMPHVLVVGSD